MYEHVIGFQVYKECLPVSKVLFDGAIFDLG